MPEALCGVVYATDEQTNLDNQGKPRKLGLHCTLYNHVEYFSQVIFFNWNAGSASGFRIRLDWPPPTKMQCGWFTY